MKSKKEQTQVIAKRNPYWSSYTVFAGLVTNKNMGMRKLKKLFYKMVDEADYSKPDSRALLKHLWYLSNPVISKAVDKYLWHKPGRINQYKLLKIENKLLKYYWLLDDPSEVGEFAVKNFIDSLLKKK